MKKAIITICPENKSGQLDCQTNGVSTLEIIDGLTHLMRQLATNLADEARAQVGNDPDKMARWIDLQRQKSHLN